MEQQIKQKDEKKSLAGKASVEARRKRKEERLEKERQEKEIVPEESTIFEYPTHEEWQPDEQYIEELVYGYCDNYLKNMSSSGSGVDIAKFAKIAFLIVAFVANNTPIGSILLEQLKSKLNLKNFMESLPVLEQQLSSTEQAPELGVTVESSSQSAQQ